MEVLWGSLFQCLDWDALIWNLRVPLLRRKAMTLAQQTCSGWLRSQVSSYIWARGLLISFFFSLTAGAGSLCMHSKEAVWLVSRVENTPPPVLILPAWVCVCPIKKRHLFLFCLNLGWGCDLLWPNSMGLKWWLCSWTSEPIGGLAAFLFSWNPATMQWGAQAPWRGQYEGQLRCSSWNAKLTS